MAAHMITKFGGRKLSRIGEKYDFRGENFRGLLTFAAPKDTTPPILRRTHLRIATKLRNPRKFSPLKVSRYTVHHSPSTNSFPPAPLITSFQPSLTYYKVQVESILLRPSPFAQTQHKHSTIFLPQFTDGTLISSSSSSSSPSSSSDVGAFA